MKEIPLNQAAKEALHNGLLEFNDEVQKVYIANAVDDMMTKEGFDPDTSLMVISPDALGEGISADQLPEKVRVTRYAPKNSCFIMPKPKSLFGFIEKIHKIKRERKK